jgi:hypothetical protein
VTTENKEAKEARGRGAFGASGIPLDGQRAHRNGHRSERSPYEEIGLATLIADLDFLIESFESVAPGWKQSLRRQWGILEEVYAVALDRGIAPLDLESEALVDRALRGLFELAASA